MLNINETGDSASPQARRRADGFRRETPETAQWRLLADSYKGLPDSVRHPHELMDGLRQARTGLKLTDAELALLTDLYAATQPKDWDRRPFAWPSNDTLASRQGKSISAIQRMIARLSRLGLIVMRDSPTGKRYGIRDGSGHITKAYGFDLSLLALRLPEFRALAARRQAENAQIRAERARASAARRQLLALIDAAEEAGLWTTYWQDASLKVALLTSSLTKIRHPERLAALTQELTALLAEAHTVLRKAAANPAPTSEDKCGDNPSDEGNMRSADGIDATLKNTTDSLHNDIYNKAQQVCNSRPDDPAYPEFATDRRRPSESDRGNPLDHVDLNRLIAGAPELCRASEPVEATWPAVRAACLPLLARYDISRRLFEDAEETIGRRMPTMIFCLMLAHGRDHYRSPGGAFRRMVERHERGELHILPSYFGLTAQAPAPAPSPLAGDLPSQLSRVLQRWKAPV
jgi:replication initiation protein RepC